MLKFFLLSQNLGRNAMDRMAHIREIDALFKDRRPPREIAGVLTASISRPHFFMPQNHRFNDRLSETGELGLVQPKGLP